MVEECEQVAVWGSAACELKLQQYFLLLNMRLKDGLKGLETMTVLIAVWSVLDKIYVCCTC